MAGSSLSKALLRNLDTNEEIPVQFNPTEYSFQKQLGWIQ